jgi:hypothetical protein
MLRGLLNLFVPKNQAQQRADVRRQIMRESAKIGGAVFGPIPEGHRREFFCLDRHTWVWHEEWTDQNKVHHARTTRYDIRPHGIFKAQDGQPYRPITEQEAITFFHATDAYAKAIDEHFVPLLAPGY